MVSEHELVQNQEGVDENAPSFPKLPHGLISPVGLCSLPTLSGRMRFLCDSAAGCCGLSEAAHCSHSEQCLWP